ncbi:MAG TPA: ATP-binding protein [Rhizomicrobium sp.]|jgi:two-component system osmolarity sensor histidine kinase EnvZ|nr:ATP-binding protein [Rhizomicrobium sp.]
MTLGRFIKQFLPRGLFGRSVIIIFAPMLLLMSVVTYVFFERDLDTTTRRMARDVAADVAFLAALEDSTPTLERDGLRALSARQLRYRLTFHEGDKVAPPLKPSTSTIDQALDDLLANSMGPRRQFETGRIGSQFDIKVDVKDGVLEILVPRDRVTVDKPDIFILWMVGSALIFLGVAILFLRNQVRPIERLARAAEMFGKGRPVADFKPYGATEVRRAAQAFITMRERIERYVNQRTEMLAGVSHDLKTPLTRMKLALAMMHDDADTRAFKADIAEMEHMLDDYLAFARGEGGEESEDCDLGELVRDTAAAVGKARAGGEGRVHITAPEHLHMSVKRAALRRCLANLVDNGLKAGRQVAVTLNRSGRYVEIAVEDDGPGIPESRREEAFRPFHRLDEGRNLQSGGSGLGLAIARDIARAHGGDIVLDKSTMGGLKATIRLPV